MIFDLYFRKKSFSGPYFLLCFLLLLLLWVPHVRAEEEETEHNIVEYFRLNRNIQREVNRLQDVEEMREERDEYRDEVIEWGREALDEIAPFFGRYEIRDPMIQHIKSPHRIMLTKRDEHVWVVGGLSLGDHFPLKEGLGMAWLAALEPGIMSAVYGLNRQAETLEAPGPWELGQAYSQQLIAEKNYQDVLLHFTEEETAENEEQKLYTFIKDTMEDLEELIEEIPFYYETGIEDYARLMNTIAGNPNTVKKTGICSCPHRSWRLGYRSRRTDESNC